ncbi:AAA family ATPase [Lysinibacillus sp. NPDC047702]|uniref:AAA family ATPase n=1 Tax=unclassified Lysinibacillus TaxID=2636778 RepID=UPI003D09528B
MASQVAEPKFFYELLRILKNAYTGDRINIAHDAEKIAEKYEKRGLQEKADKLRVQVQRLGNQRGNSNLDEMAKKLGYELFYPNEAAIRARDFVPTQKNKEKIAELIAVVRKKEVFWEAEIPIPNKTLLFGPPGTGKTISAHYIASLLNLPLILVRLDTLIDSHLGGTANNLRKLFDVANKQSCVLFLDEFDAIANNRNALKGDGPESEMKRVVNSLLQNLDALNDEVILLAATNLDSDIDPAVWRRFHNRMDYELPNEDELLFYLSKNLTDNFLIHEILTYLIGRSFSDIEIILNKAKTKSILRSVELSAALIQESLDELILQDRSTS